MTAAVIHCIGENGAELGFTEPVPPEIRKRIASGALRVVGDAHPSTTPELSLAQAPGVVDVPRVEEPSADPLAVPVPRGNASREDWIAYAVSQGMPHEEAVSLKRDDLKARLVLDDEPEV